jgi:hemolysin type calcium-binding protein
MRRTNGLAAAVAAAIACLAVPAGANADWQEVGFPISSTSALSGSYEPMSDTPQYDLKRIGGTLYRAWTSSGTIYVERLTDRPRQDQLNGLRWEFPNDYVVPVNRDITRSAEHPSLAAGPDGTPWLAWDEVDRYGVRQIRVARLDEASGRWIEPDGRDWEINSRPPPGYDPRDFPEWSSLDPRLVFLGGRPYVAYIQDGPIEYSIQVVRLAADGHSWERVGSLPEVIPYGVDAAVIGGSLYVGTTGGFGRPELYRLTANGFEKVGGSDVNTSVMTQYGPQDGAFNRVAGFGDEPYVLWRGDDNEVYPAHVTGGSWQLAGGGVGPGRDGTSLRTIGGRLYAAWIDSGSPDGLHVSRLADDGSSWIDTSGGPIATIVSHTAVLSSLNGVPYVMYLQTDGESNSIHVAKLDGAPAPIAADDGEGSGPGSDAGIGATPILPPREQPKPKPKPKPAKRGPCGVIHEATAGPNAFVGGSRADCLFGGAGNDLLRGRGGDDRLYGGEGNDRLYGGADDDHLYGGPGADLLVGGGGWDVFHGGPGNDTIKAADGRAESVYCGSGYDTVTADRFDRLHGCERVKIVGRR